MEERITRPTRLALRRRPLARRPISPTKRNHALDDGTARPRYLVDHSSGQRLRPSLQQDQLHRCSPPSADDDVLDAEVRYDSPRTGHCPKGRRPLRRTQEDHIVNHSEGWTRPGTESEKPWRLGHILPVVCASYTLGSLYIQMWTRRQTSKASHSNLCSVSAIQHSKSSAISIGWDSVLAHDQAS